MGARQPARTTHARRGGKRTASPLPAAAGTHYAALAAAVNEQIEPVYHCTVTLVQYPSQGDFPWYYQNANQVFNAATFGYISARVMPGDAPGLAALSASGGFPNAYARLLADLTFSAGAASLVPPTSLRDNQFGDQAQLITELLDTTTTPTASNGGMQTVDPVTGEVSSTCQVGYAVSTPLASIQTALADQDCALTVTLSGTGGAAVRIVYPGYTMVAVSSTSWQQATGIGWFYPDPVSEAFENAGHNVAGFQFTDPPPYQPGPPTAGGDVGWLVGLLVSAPPQVSVSSSSGALPSTAQARVGDDILEGLTLLGLPPPTRSLGSTRLGDQPSVPLLQQTAYVIGAVIGFLGQP